jgi:xanthine/uracil permease
MFKLSIILLMTGKFGAFFASIPLPIFAAAYCVLFGIVGECRSYFFLSEMNVSFFWPTKNVALPSCYH